MIIKILEPIDDSHLEKMDQINHNTSHYEDVQHGSEAPAPLNKGSLALLSQLGVGLEFLKKDLPGQPASPKPQPADDQSPKAAAKDDDGRTKYHPPTIPLDRALNTAPPPEPAARAEAGGRANLLLPLSGAALIGLAIVLFKIFFS